MNEVLKLAWDHRARWWFIGVELGIEQGDLDAISADHMNVDERLTEVIKIWLRKIKPKPTRSAIMAALQSERVSGATCVYGACPHNEEEAWII